MPGLDPGFDAAQPATSGMDCRVKPGNDGNLVAAYMPQYCPLATNM